MHPNNISTRVSTYFINLILFLIFFFFNNLFICFKSFIIYKEITFFVTRKLYDIFALVESHNFYKINIHFSKNYIVENID